MIFEYFVNFSSCEGKIIHANSYANYSARPRCTQPAGLCDPRLNVPERDYRTFEEMCSFFPKDEPSTARNALTELKDEKYVIIIHGNTYAVNKLRIPNMKLR